MAKLHMRLSVEIEVTEEQLREIYYGAEFGDKKPNREPNDIDVASLPFPLGKITPCDWDYGGYIPGNWLESDAVDAGIVKLEEVGM